MSKLYPIGTILRTQINRNIKKWIYPFRIEQLNPNIERYTYGPKDEWLMESEVKVVVMDEPNDKIIYDLIKSGEIEKHLCTITNSDLTEDDLYNFSEQNFVQDGDGIVRVDGFIDGRSWDYGAPYEHPTWDSSRLRGIEVELIGDEYMSIGNEHVKLNLVEGSAFASIQIHEEDIMFVEYNRKRFRPINPSVEILYKPSEI